MPCLLQVQVLVQSIEDRIKKLIADVKLLKDGVAALANGTATPAPVLIQWVCSYFFGLPVP